MTAPHPPSHLPEDVAAVWVEITTAYGDGWPAIAGPALDAYCAQVAVHRDATDRIARDGLIVEGPKGEPITHPAIAIQRTAQDEIRRWGDAFKPPRRRR